jgi:galactokinase
VRHRLTDGGYNQRREECEEALRSLRGQGWDLKDLAAYPSERLPAPLPPLLARRVRHVVSETVRVHRAVELLTGPRGDEALRLPQVGRLLTESHGSLRDDFQSSCEEADVLVEAAVKLGAVGARLTGAGWGGIVIVLAPETEAARIIVELQHQFGRIYRRLPEAWMTRASSGVKGE